MTHPALDELVAWRDGEATPVTSAHMDDCRECQAAAADLGSLRQRLRELQTSGPPADGWSALEARLTGRRQAHFLARCGWASAAAMILFTVAVAVRGGIEAWEEARLTRETRALVAESQRLETILRSADRSGRVTSSRTALAMADIEERIELVDARLAASQRERRSSRDVLDLWQQRVSLLDNLASAQTARVAYVGL
ncbi:MAG TPA: hypothetical protein PLS53_03650 [Thermoanaerobaculaceae bacterium]|nr:hypothetical protein [Thermoanaerobaculaceae bacterium]HPS77231.1 hypothetical protein [Thermoanaerobaculaceae bacterium]